jgi:ribosomal protein S18 acetylase RimI-like enzyme
VNIGGCDIDLTLDAVPVDLHAAQSAKQMGTAMGGSMADFVRPAGVDDAGAIGRLLYDFNREFGEPTPEPSALAERIRQLLKSGDTVVLLAGDGPDGLAVLRFRAAIWSTGLECYLAELYVTPARRGQGLGRALMTVALREARKRGADSMDIGVDEPDVAARHLYESLGFTNRAGAADGPVMYVYEREL